MASMALPLFVSKGRAGSLETSNERHLRPMSRTTPQHPSRATRSHPESADGCLVPSNPWLGWAFAGRGIASSFSGPSEGTARGSSKRGRDEQTHATHTRERGDGRGDRRVFVVAPAAGAKSDDVVARGKCTAAARWRLELSTTAGGKFEVDYKVFSMAGQTWRVVARHNGAVYFRGSRVSHDSPRISRWISSCATRRERTASRPGLPTRCPVRSAPGRPRLPSEGLRVEGSGRPLTGLPNPLNVACLARSDNPRGLLTIC